MRKGRRCANKTSESLNYELSYSVNLYMRVLRTLGIVKPSYIFIFDILYFELIFDFHILFCILYFISRNIFLIYNSIIVI